MKTYELQVLIIGWEKVPLVKWFEVRANSFAMAAGVCKGQAAVNGWKILDILDYKV